MPLRVAFAGFRHGHVLSFVNAARNLDYCEIVGVVEESDDDLQYLQRADLERTHATVDEMLDDVEVDLLATAEYYARRGSVVIKGLQSGAHVISDKPLCTEIDELREIKRLAEESDLQVAMQLSMRFSPVYQTMRRIVQDGELGQFLAASVFGQHPLGYPDTRPGWYFEEGKHGGTINDIFIHGADMLRYCTGLEFETVVAAEAWNASLPEVPFFQVGAQCMLAMQGGPHVLADVSYMPGRGWQFFLTGSEAYLAVDHDRMLLSPEGGEERHIQPQADQPSASPFEDLASHLEHGTERFLPTEEVFRSQMAVLAAQRAADTGERDMPVPQI
ncbi:MAG: Gfo/Idh/MocA family oxidoreductase [Armatimonadota bacterium]|nr:Gfo/Idh/MocA family oxidoreductase [Armatimonadota bacterium]